MSLKQDNNNFRFGFSFGLGFMLAVVVFIIAISPVLCVIGALLKPVMG